MKKLNFLKAILDLFWFFSCLAIVGILVVVGFYLFDVDFDIPIKINDVLVTTKTSEAKILVISGICSSFVFMYSIYCLREVIILFQKKEIFTNKVITYFNYIGIAIITSTLISNVSLFLFKILVRDFAAISVDFGGYDSFLISICLGLFFMVISEIFKIVKAMKEESELTI